MIILFAAAALPAWAEHGKPKTPAHPYGTGKNQHKPTEQVWTWPATWKPERPAIIAEQQSPSASDRQDTNRKAEDENAADLFAKRSADAAVDQAFYAKWQTIIGAVGAFVGALAAAFAGWAAFAAAAAAEAARKSVDEAKRSTDQARSMFVAERRPWVTAEAFPLGIKYDVNGLNVGVRFILSNKGNSPARNVNVFPTVYCTRMRVDGPRKIDHPNQIIRDMIASRNGIELPWGSTIHQNQTTTEDMFVLSISKDELAELTKDFEAIRPSLLVVVEYRFTFEPGAHYTAFGVDIRSTDPPHKAGWAPNLIIPALGDIPENRLCFTRSFCVTEYAD